MIIVIIITITMHNEGRIRIILMIFIIISCCIINTSVGYYVRYYQDIPIIMKSSVDRDYNKCHYVILRIRRHRNYAKLSSGRMCSNYGIRSL
jgi:hypothetical protein